MKTNNQLESIINRLVSSSNPDEVKDLYRQWAESYNQDLDNYGYVAPDIACHLFATHIPVSATSILDAGCGTGLVGAILGELGYNNITGVDFSPDMLEKAATTSCYSSLRQADFSDPLSEADNSYDAAIAVGVYTKRFKDSFLDEIIRILKPGGGFLFTCREQYYVEVAEKIMELHQAKSLRFSEIRLDDYMKEQQALAYYIFLQKCFDGEY